jgi:hypothetical protein
MAGCVPVAREPFFVPVGDMADATGAKEIAGHSGCDEANQNTGF